MPRAPLSVHLFLRDRSCIWSQLKDILFQKAKVWKLLKTIHGLIQAPLAFYQLCSKVYTKVGYTQLKSDECVFVCQEDNVRKGSKSAKHRKPIVSLTVMSVIPEKRQSVQRLNLRICCGLHFDIRRQHYRRSNCEILVRRFHAEVRIDGSIDLSLYWQSYLVCWVSDTRMMDWLVLFLLSDAITKQGNKRQVNPTKIPMICKCRFRCDSDIREARSGLHFQVPEADRWTHVSWR